MLSNVECGESETSLELQRSSARGSKAAVAIESVVSGKAPRGRREIHTISDSQI